MKLGNLHRAFWGADSALAFYDRLSLPQDDAERFAWKIRARIGSDDINVVISDAAARLAEATTDQERLPLYGALIRAELSAKDYPSVEATIAEMRSVIANDARVDRALMDIVGGHLGPRGEVLLNNIIGSSTSEQMQQFATFEMGWCKRYAKDREGSLEWFEQAATMSCIPGSECLYPWKAHMEAAAAYRAKGSDFLPHAEAHLQDALLLAQEHYPRGVGESYLNLGGLREVQGDLSGAAELYEQAANAATGDDQKSTWAKARIGLGRVQKKQDNLIAARETLQEVKNKAFHRRHVEHAERLLAQMQRQT